MKHLLESLTPCALSCLFIITASEGYAEPQPSILCEVIAHLDQHIGQDLVVKGMIVSYEHGVYLTPDLQCTETAIRAIPLKGFDIAGYRAAGGTKGFGVLATVRGKLVAFDRQAKGTKENLPVLSVRTVLYEKNRHLQGR
jgi:hypothetical protein